MEATPATDKPTERKYHGAFMTLRQNRMTDPTDEDRYDKLTWTIGKSQGAVLLYTLFWAHLMDYGSFLKAKPPKGTRIALYVATAGIPSAIHALYASSWVTELSNSLDIKYSQKFEEFQLLLRTKKSQPNAPKQ